MGLQVVERGRARVVEDDDVVEHARRDAWGDGHRAIARGANEDLVEDPVVGAGEHRDSVPAADRAGEAYGGGHRLGSRVAERHALHSDHGCDAGGDLPGERRLGAGLDSLVELCLQRLAHEGGVVAEQDRPEAVGEVDVLVPVDVPQPRAGGTDGHDRVDELLPGEAEPGDGTGIGQMSPMGRRRLLGAGGAPRVPLDEGIHRLLLLGREAAGRCLRRRSVGAESRHRRSLGGCRLGRRGGRRGRRGASCGLGTAGPASWPPGRRLRRRGASPTAGA